MWSHFVIVVLSFSAIWQVLCALCQGTDTQKDTFYDETRQSAQRKLIILGPIVSTVIERLCVFVIFISSSESSISVLHDEFMHALCQKMDAQTNTCYGET